MVEDFIALAGYGYMTVIVQNTGVVTADFAVHFHEDLLPVYVWLHSD